MSMWMDRIRTSLYYGPVRRVFRAVLRRTMNNSGVVCAGPLKGWIFPDGAMACRYGIYEYPVQVAIWRRLKRGGVFYDIGGNDGFFTMLGSKGVGDNGKVIVFEPVENCRERINAVAAKNDVKYCEVLPVAISDSVGEADFYEMQDANVASLAQKSDAIHRRVPTITLDEAVKQNPFPSVIKLDIEGAETMALKGATEMLARKDAPSWVIEIHDEANETAVIGMLKSNGYKIEQLRVSVKSEGRYPLHIAADKPGQ